MVRFDGDGLTDTYEARTVGTDPLDPDSDATVTSADEAGDGVPDGGEDFDDDGLITFAEADRGTDPFQDNSDGDGLGDRFEASVSLVDMTNRDTDGDGRPDGSEDFDDDGLDARFEWTNQTSIASPDTDHDGLDDSVEIRDHGTSPIRRDSDGDGLGDGEEVSLGTDPLRRDTDGDGLPDGEERFETSATDTRSGVSVSVRGRGDVSSGVSIEPVAQPADLTIVAGPVVRIRNRTAFGHASVTLPITSREPVERAENLSVFTWEPNGDRPWHPVPSTVDAVNGTVRADVESFSYFSVIDERRWRNATGDIVEPGWPRFEGFDDLAGWSVEGDAFSRDGRLVLSAGRRADIVVDPSGGGDFRRIQPAVASARSGETVLVTPGIYREELVVDTSIRLLGWNATLSGKGFDGGGVAIRVQNDTSVTVSGFDIVGYSRGVNGSRTNSDVRLEGLRLRETDLPVEAYGATGEWTLAGVETAGAASYSVNSEGSTGPWLVSHATFDGGGILADSATGDWTVSNATVVGRSDGIDAWQSSGDWRITNTTLEAGDEGLDATQSRGSFILRHVVSAGNGNGIEAFHSTGDWTIARVDLRGNERYGLHARYAEGSWRLWQVNSSANGVSGIAAGHSVGDWQLGAVAVSDNGRSGLDAFEATGDWQLWAVSATGNEAWSGVEAYGTRGDWQVSELDVSNNGRDGLATTASSGHWRVTAAKIVANVETGMDGAGAAGHVSIRRSAVYGNGGVDLDARRVSGAFRAEEIWWGQPDGPVHGQVMGNVSISGSCADHSCTPAGAPVTPSTGVLRPDVSGRRTTDGTMATGSSTQSVGRAVPLPAEPTNITVTVNVTARPTRDADGGIRLQLGNRSRTVRRVENGSGEESTTFTDVGGESTWLEIAPESGATVEIEWIDVAFDTDGDGLRDLVETSSIGMPVGPVPGAPLDGLDPADPDSDGDGLLDGEELTAVRVGQVPDQTSEIALIWPVSATADPTNRNSDGGGLTDAEERAVGSDPFVLETLVAGFTLPTMTDGDGLTIEDGNPMTIGEVDGYQFGRGESSNLIAWPSRQFFDPAFCIKELTAGPGCSPGWMRGVDIRGDRHYLYVPYLVYANSNVDLLDVPYTLSFSSTAFVRPVKRVNATGSFGPRYVHRGYVVYEVPDDRTGVELYAAGFRPIGELEYSVGLDETVFERGEDAATSHQYSVSTSTMLPRMDAVLEDTRFVLSQGLTIASATETGYAVAVKTGSRARGALAFIYEILVGQVETPPKSLEGLAEKATDEGIASFQQKINIAESKIHQEVFENGSVRPVGPTIIRQN